MMKTHQIIAAIALLLPGVLFAQSGTWETTRADMPVHKWAHSACVVDGKIYVIGGYVPVDLVVFNSIGSSGVEVYDPVSNTWDTNRTAMPTARAYAAIASLGGKIYVCGGATSVFGSTMDILEIYNPTTDTWDVTQPPMPTARYECRGLVFNGEFIVIGGFGEGSGKEVEAFDPETKQWRKLPNLPLNVSSMSVDTLNGKIYVTGGIPTSNNPVKKIQSYDPQTNSWQTESLELPYEISHLGSVSAPGKIFLCGGNGFQLTPDSWELFRDVFMFDPASQSIQKITELPTPRAGLTTHLINGALFVLGGYYPRTDIQDWSEMLRPVLEVYHLPVYPYNTHLNAYYYRPELDSIAIHTQLFNYFNNSITIQAQLVGIDNDFFASIDLFDDGMHTDGLSGDGIYGNNSFFDFPEGFYQVDISTINLTSGTTFTTSKSAQFSTVGPVVFHDINFSSADTVPNPGDNLSIKPGLRNTGLTGIAGNVTAQIESLDPTWATFSHASYNFGQILPGEILETTSTRRKLAISGDCPDNTLLTFTTQIYSNGFLFWRDTFQIKVGSGYVSGIDDFKISTYKNITIFPNPTPGIINITGLSKPAEVKLYSIQGQLMNSFVHVEKVIDVSDLTPGIYILNISTNDGNLVRKMVKK